MFLLLYRFHLHLGLNLSPPLSLITRFHIGHVYEVQGKPSMAKDMYESILKWDSVTNKVIITLLIININFSSKRLEG